MSEQHIPQAMTETGWTRPLPPHLAASNAGRLVAMARSDLQRALKDLEGMADLHRQVRLVLDDLSDILGLIREAEAGA